MQGFFQLVLTKFRAATCCIQIKITIGIGVVVAFVASLTPVGKLEEMVNIGTLTAFFLVSIAIPVLRRSRPDLQRSFRVPLSPFLPWLSALICLFLMVNLAVGDGGNWIGKPDGSTQTFRIDYLRVYDKRP